MARPSADGRPFVYAPADFLTIPSLEGIPQIIATSSDNQADTATLAQFAEALRAHGVVRYQDFTNTIADTLEVGVSRWAGRHTGREDKLKVLHWWHMVVSENIEGLDSLYDATYAKKELIERLNWQAPMMSAFALEAASDRQVKLGDALTRLEECLEFLKVRSEPALKSLMGTINRAGSLCGAWTPATLHDHWVDSDWEEDELGAMSREEWNKIPSWLYSWAYSAPSLQRLARRLQPTETTFSGVYWIIYYAFQLAQELNHWDKNDARYTDDLFKIEHGCAPSMFIGWLRGNEPDSLSHYADYEMECLYQSEYHAAQWLAVFDPCNPESTRRAVLTMEGLMRIIGKLDSLLDAINTFAQHLPTVPVRVKALPLAEVLNAEVVPEVVPVEVRVRV